MSKKTTNNLIDKVEKVELSIVTQLEDKSKCGFYAERTLNQLLFQPLFRLRCEHPTDIDAEDLVLTPWCTIEQLHLMLVSFLDLTPVLFRVIQEKQKNAPAPEEGKIE